MRPCVHGVAYLKLTSRFSLVVSFYIYIFLFLPFLEFYNFAPVINPHQSWLYLSYLVILRCEQRKRVDVRCHYGRKVYVSESCQLMLKE